MNDKLRVRIQQPTIFRCQQVEDVLPAPPFVLVVDGGNLVGQLQRMWLGVAGMSTQLLLQQTMQNGAKIHVSKIVADGAN